MSKQKTIKVVQIASPIGRKGYQKKCLIGLGLNKINRARKWEIRTIFTIIIQTIWIRIKIYWTILWS